MRKNTPDNYGVKELQNVILNITKDIDDFCTKYRIGYRLMGGSALGAKRHEGFIPWDDDLDIFMTPDEYEQFRKTFIQYGDKEKYYLQEFGATNGMVTTAKIRLNHSYYEEEVIKDWHIHQGVFVDIFILHTCPDKKWQQTWQYFWAKYIILKGLANKPAYHRKKGCAAILIKVMRLLPKRFLLNYALKQVYRYRHDKTDYYCNYLGKALKKNGTYKKEYFEGIKRVPFEKITLNVNKNLEQFLTDRFGNYMKPPSPERIEYEQHSTTWNLEEYDYSDRSDEKYLI